MIKAAPDQQPVDLLTTLADHTVRLLECNNAHQMCGKIGSGFLWEEGKRLHLISVAHTFRDVKHQLKLDAGLVLKNRAMLLNLPAQPGFLKAVSLLPGNVGVHQQNILADVRDIDFAWVTFDKEALAATIKAGAPKGSTLSMPVIRHSLDVLPSADRSYFFAARIPTKYHAGTGTFDWQEISEEMMKYKGVEQAGKWQGMYRFELDRPHQGDAYYYGSSGAPIADELGNPVAVVAAGDPEQNAIFGCPLQPYVRYLNL